MAERKSASGFISNALTGGSGKSAGIMEKDIGMGQKINTTQPTDNVKLAMCVESSMRDEGGFGGGKDSLKHSLTGASAVQDKV